MEYTKEELEAMKMPELKLILKNRNLKSSGNKSELIDRILKTEAPKKVEKQQFRGKTYFDILPSDITKMVTRYRAEAEINNKIAFDILEEIAKHRMLASRYSPIKILEKLEFPMRISPVGGMGRGWNVEIIENIPINDEALTELILALIIKKNILWETVNSILQEYNSNMRVLKEFPNKYTVGYFRPIKTLYE